MNFLVWLTMGAALIIYVLTAGADFGAGLWDVLASDDDERGALEHAIAPIWEANHVWLIFIIVVMFTAFPKAFAMVSIQFHIPLVLVLIGIVLRGSGFVFRAYGLAPGRLRDTYGRIFAWASIFTPFFLGLILAGMSSAALDSPFAIAVGIFTLALFALLTAVYMTLDAAPLIAARFRVRALACEAVCGLTAGATLFFAFKDAPMLAERFTQARAFWPIQATCAIAAAAVIWSLAARRYRLARLAVMAQVAFVVIGWGVAMRGSLILGVIDIDHAGANPRTLQLLLPTIAAGAVLLIPSLILLLRIFKASHGEPGAPPIDSSPRR